jgi:hypothetical protein
MSNFCPICLEPFTIFNPADSNKQYGFQGCDHEFCIPCLSKLHQMGECKCPLCRGDLTELLDTYDFFTDSESD